MPVKSHDDKFKNLFLDFPVESLQWVLPQALESWGDAKRVEFVRQEPKKRNLSDRGLVLDLPILFEFEKKRLLLWLVEFQEDKSKFSIHKLLRYTTDLMEAYPDATVIPTVLFSDRKRWRKAVSRKLESRLNDRLFVHFEYVFVKLFDFKARDYYNTDNPVVNILLPKMDYRPEERFEVIRRAYAGLYRLCSEILFDKYVDFIDMYAEVGPDERETLFQEIVQHEETAMLAQYIRKKGWREGLEQGLERGLKRGLEKGAVKTGRENIVEVLETRFGKIPADIVERINAIDDPAHLKALLRKAIRMEKIDREKLFP